MADLLDNLDLIHTTVLGVDRIKKNLNLSDENVIEYCKNAILNADMIMRLGKNYYVYYKGQAITVNAKSYTVITAHAINAKVRVMTPSDYICLDEFLYQSIFIPKDAPYPDRSIINDPSINIYIKGFGNQVGDFGVVAEQNGQICGIAWTRIIPAYGHIDNQTPELAISVLPEFRGCGIGTKLMGKLFNVLRENGYKQTSLSVNKSNPAVNFYTKLGYKLLPTENTEDFLMLKTL